MKTAIFIFLVGAAAGAFGYYYLQEKRGAPTPPPRPVAAKPATEPSTSPSLSERARDDARAVKDTVANKLTEWHLTPDEISNDLSRTGQAVQTKAQSTGAKIASTAAHTRIITVIKTKYTLDKELSARTIAVSYKDGLVTLEGSVANTPLIAKAVGIALETEGVTQVKSLLTVVPAEKK